MPSVKLVSYGAGLKSLYIKSFNYVFWSVSILLTLLGNVVVYLKPPIWLESHGERGIFMVDTPHKKSSEYLWWVQNRPLQRTCRLLGCSFWCGVIIRFVNRILNICACSPCWYQANIFFVYVCTEAKVAMVGKWKVRSHSLWNIAIAPFISFMCHWHQIWNFSSSWR